MTDFKSSSPQLPHRSWGVARVGIILGIVAVLIAVAAFFAGYALPPGTKPSSAPRRPG